LFTHLHVHTEFSMLDGLSHIPGLVQRTVEQGATALGITDHGGMYGVVDFYSACQTAGIKPIIGCELYVAPESRHGRRAADKNPHHLTVLAQNNQGYHNLMKLVTKASLEGFYYKPRVDKELLEEHHEGLIVLSGCPSAELSRLLIDNDLDGARKLARWFQGTFPHFYLELQRHGNMPLLDDLNAGLLRMAEELDIPLVATNDLHYVSQEDAPYQDVMVCIQTNTNIHDEKRLKMSDDSYYLKSPQEMSELFHDLPEAVENTQVIANLCDVTLDFSTLHLPEFPVPEGQDADSYLRKLCWQGFEQRFSSAAPAESRQRLEYELDVVTQTRYPTYFLVVWEIANFARQNQILFGVRGSAASSLALYCLGVTDINPLEYNLVFERFLNVERKEMPDIDMDFQDDRREEAIRHVVERYGSAHVAQIITFGTLGAKAAIRDVGRALGLPYTDVDQVARMIPTRLGITLETARQESTEMQETYAGDETLRGLIDTASKLEGTVRNSSTHAAGVVISKEPLAEHVPLQRPTKSDDQGAIMTQYPMEPLAKLGLLKMDFLGLANLTILSMTRDLVRQTRGTDIDIQSIPLDDQATFALLGSGETTGLFQLESTGMRRYIKELSPTNLGDLAAMIALYRPGPMEHIGSFIDAKYHRREAKSPHPVLDDILKETYGIIVYQDQVLHVLRTFAGYTLGAADIVRKAMGKKIPELMAQERERFVAGAAGLGYEPQIAEKVFDLIEPFAGYAFNKAHSVSYALVAYWTAYFKANYCVEFMTSVLNAYRGNTDKVASVASECARLDIPLLAPDVNRSQVEFAIDTDGRGRQSIRFGLSAVKHVGASAVASLVEERQAHGAFQTLEEFCRRAGPHVANRRVLESLMRVGAMDSLGPRGQLLATVDQIMGLLQRESQLQRSGQSTMFDLFGKSMPTPLGNMQLRDAQEPSAAERALWERQLLGISLSGTSFHQMANSAPSNAILSREDLELELTNAKVLVIGPVSAVRITQDKEQRRIAFVTVDLFHGSVEVAVWSRVFAATDGLWEEGAIVQISGAVTRRNDVVGIRCDKAGTYDFPDAEEEPADPPVDGPKMEEWPGPSPELAPTLSQQQPDSAPVPPASDVYEKGLGASQETMAGHNGHQPAYTPSATTVNGAHNSALDADHGHRKILINLTETDHPEEDTYLLRQVLTLLLDYPGTDSVDLIIFSQGTRYRLEMPIIATRFCPELQAQIASLLGTQHAVTIQGPA
jgi:DNA polymerase-3 subunit alpha